MRKEDDFELIQMKYFAYVEQQFVGIVTGIVLGCFVEDLVWFVGETGLDVVVFELLVGGGWSWL